MPAERNVSCPSCLAERPTRAGAGTRLRCPSCGTTYRAPAPTPGEPAPAAPPAPAPGEPAVTRATAVTVRQRARKASRATKAPAPVVEPVPPAPPVPPPAGPAPARAKVLGRRGGHGYYSSRVRSARG